MVRAFGTFTALRRARDFHHPHAGHVRAAPLNVTLGRVRLCITARLCEFFGLFCLLPVVVIRPPYHFLELSVYPRLAFALTLSVSALILPLASSASASPVHLQAHHAKPAQPSGGQSGMRVPSSPDAPTPQSSPAPSHGKGRPVDPAVVAAKAKLAQAKAAFIACKQANTDANACADLLAALKQAKADLRAAQKAASGARKYHKGHRHSPTPPAPSTDPSAAPTDPSTNPTPPAPPVDPAPPIPSTDPTVAPSVPSSGGSQPPVDAPPSV